MGHTHSPRKDELDDADGLGLQSHPTQHNATPNEKTSPSSKVVADQRCEW